MGYVETAGSQRFGGEIVNFSPVTLNGRTLNSCYAAVLTLGELRQNGVVGWGCWLARPPRARRDRRERREAGGGVPGGDCRPSTDERRDA